MDGTSFKNYSNVANQARNITVAEQNHYYGLRDPALADDAEDFLPGNSSFS